MTEPERNTSLDFIDGRVVLMSYKMFLQFGEVTKVRQRQVWDMSVIQDSKTKMSNISSYSRTCVRSSTAC